MASEEMVLLVPSETPMTADLSRAELATCAELVSELEVVPECGQETGKGGGTDARGLMCGGAGCSTGLRRLGCESASGQQRREGGRVYTAITGYTYEAL
jgi:hypothetical protein